MFISCLVSCTLLVLVSGQSSDVHPHFDLTYPGFRDPYYNGGSFCGRLSESLKCCTDRRDECSTPRGTTRCYCDSFCNKHGPNQDCCPDYESLCEDRQLVTVPCIYGGRRYQPGHVVEFLDHCYSCTCRNITDTQRELHCRYTCGQSRDCPYNGIAYHAGSTVDIGDSCYTCDCLSSFTSYPTISCRYICPIPTIPPKGYKCHHENQFWREGETKRANCKICTCQRLSNGEFGVTCYTDPECDRPVEPPKCHHENQFWREGETKRANCKICTCQRFSNGEFGVTCYTDPECDPPVDPPRCYYNSQYYTEGIRIRMGLQECACTRKTSTSAEFVCTGIIVPKDLVNVINAGTYGWIAYKYSFLVGHTLEEVFRTRTGVCKPEIPKVAKSRVYGLQGRPAAARHQVDTFDARTQWPGYVRPISDATNHPISWAITIADVVADRRAIISLGRENKHLSAQNLVSCVRKYSSSDCSSTLKGWEYLQNYGIVAQECYPLNFFVANTCQVDMGGHTRTASCPSGSAYNMFFRAPQPRHISGDELDIRVEITNYGPVQAHIRVKEDFFYYRSGVYKHSFENTQNNREYYLAVRIIGWGTDTSTGQPIHYWICANSWGTSWGENGLFRIVRGTNECHIEEYVYAVTIPYAK